MKKKNKPPTITGFFTGNARGFGFVTPEEPGKPDIFIPEKYTNGALHGDTVYCILAPDPREDRHTNSHSNSRTENRMEGRITGIRQRGNKTLVGTFYTAGRGGYIVPLENKIPHHFFLPPSERKHWLLADGFRVLFEPNMHHPDGPHATVIEKLGHMNEPGVDVLSILRQYGVPTTFPQVAMDEAAALPDTVNASECTGRLDLRDAMLITIDGEDTKDIDDAVSLTVTPEGLFELGVHIADVTHYVRANTALDTEALRRGTSIYPADRVIPMLPPLLSNGICSLFPGVDRLTLSCIMTIDTEGRVTEHRIVPSIINSKRRFTYEHVNTLLTSITGNEDSNISENSVNDPRHENVNDDASWLPLLQNMNRLRQILWEKRRRRGALSFDFPERKIRLDEKGWPISIAPYERNDATGLIEEFMIVCNETVAEHFYWLETPFIYRIHEEPEPDKLRQLAAFVREFGCTLRGNTGQPGALQRLLAQAEGKPAEAIIHQAVLRSLQQARYSPGHLGHYGLASPYYCHFTSPIRRYPDLQIHRIIKAVLSGLGEDEAAHYHGVLPEVCRSCSRAERTAEALEREVAQLKMVQFMSDKEGRLFDAIVTGVTPWGVYAALTNTGEGLLPMGHLRSVGFRHDEKSQSYTHQRHGEKKTLRVGGKVTIMLDRADIEERKLYFMMADDDLYL